MLTSCMVFIERSNDWYQRQASNLHGSSLPLDPKSNASTNSTTLALFGGEHRYRTESASDALKRLAIATSHHQGLLSYFTNTYNQFFSPHSSMDAFIGFFSRLNCFTKSFAAFTVSLVGSSQS